MARERYLLPGREVTEAILPFAWVQIAYALQAALGGNDALHAAITELQAENGEAHVRAYVKMLGALPYSRQRVYVAALALGLNLMAVLHEQFTTTVELEDTDESDPAEEAH